MFLKGRIRSLRWVVIALPLFFSFLFFFFLPLRARADLASNGEQKSLLIWDKKVQYQLLIQSDPKAVYDGESFARLKDGVETRFVVLNPAFSEKEGRELFHRLSCKTKTFTFAANPALENLEKKFLSEDLSDKILRKDRSLRKALVILQCHLEQSAWAELKARALRESPSRREAELRFVQYFEKVRMKSVEIHEVAHLIDLEENGDDPSLDFDRYTELNAFFSELAYGSNPQDVMAQALAGVIDEMEDGKSTDYSSFKVANVLKILKQDPRFREGFPEPLSGWSLLMKVKNSDFSEAGKSLYRDNRQAFSSSGSPTFFSPSGE
jgi:hypothetical protein